MQSASSQFQEISLRTGSFEEEKSAGRRFAKKKHYREKKIASYFYRDQYCVCSKETKKTFKRNDFFSTRLVSSQFQSLKIHQ